MEQETKFKTLTIAVTEKTEYKAKDSHTDHVFMNVWDKFFTSPLTDQLVFPWIGQVKTYLKSQISQAKKAVKKLFKRVKIKVQKEIISTQLVCKFN